MNTWSAGEAKELASITSCDGFVLKYSLPIWEKILDRSLIARCSASLQKLPVDTNHAIEMTHNQKQPNNTHNTDSKMCSLAWNVLNWKGIHSSRQAMALAKDDTLSGKVLASRIQSILATFVRTAWRSGDIHSLFNHGDSYHFFSVNTWLKYSWKKALAPCFNCNCNTSISFCKV